MKRLIRGSRATLDMTTRAHLAVATATVIAMIGGISRVSAADAIFQGNEARTGCDVKLNLTQPPKVIWKFQSENAGGLASGFGGIVADDRRVFCSDGSGRLVALKSSDGTTLWTSETGGNNGCSEPLVMADVAYYATSSAILALSAIDGTQVWKYDIPLGANETSPLLIGDLIVVCGYDGVVHAVDAQTGKPEWSHDIVEDAPPAPPGFDGAKARFGDKLARPRIGASDGKTLFQPVFDQSRLVAIDAKTGERRWAFRAGGWIHANPVATANHVFIGTQDRHFYCLDKATGAIVWKFATKSRIEAGAAVDGDAVYFGSCDGKFFRLDAKTGRQMWSFQCDPDSNGRACAIYSAPVVAQDVLYFNGMEGQVYALEAGDGRLRWKFRPSDFSEIDSSLASDGERLFLITRSNRDQAGENAIFAIGAPK